MIKAVKSIKEVVLTGHDLTLAELVAVARYDAKIKLAESAIESIKKYTCHRR
mgnify:CR=1 FL=1